MGGITQYYLAAVTFPPLPQPKLVLDLVTAEGCKAELTCWWLYPKIVKRQKTVTYLRNSQAASWPGIEPATVSSESNVLMTRPLSQVILECKHVSVL